MSNPYSVKDVSDGTYGFETVHGIVYTVYFTDGSGYFSDYPDFAEAVLTFGFDVKYSLHFQLPPDDRVRITLTEIIHQFFSANPTKVLFFVCDTKNKKQQSRMRTFERWYKKTEYLFIEKLNEEIKTEETNLYCSLLLHSQNPLKEKIAAAFRQLRSDLESKLSN